MVPVLAPRHNAGIPMHIAIRHRHRSIRFPLPVGSRHSAVHRNGSSGGFYERALFLSRVTKFPSRLYILPCVCQAQSLPYNSLRKFCGNSGDILNLSENFGFLLPLSRSTISLSLVIYQEHLFKIDVVNNTAS